MGMTVNYTPDTAAEVLIEASISRGLQAGGAVILEASNLLAPVEEGEPRHGVHMVETGFVRPETFGGVQRVAVGYGAFWAVWQETKLEYHHDHGQAQFLETAFLTTSAMALEKVAATVREALSE